MQESQLNLRNMYTRSCIRLVEQELGRIAQVEVIFVRMGSAGIRFDPRHTPFSQIEKHMDGAGFPIVNDPDIQITENVKLAAIELIFGANNLSSLIRNSDYISDKLQLPYERISRIFSRITGHTLEKYLIMLKIERAKELMLNNEYTLSEISYMMGYSSVQYLSNQFKKVAGITVSEFRDGGRWERIPLEDLPEKYPNRNFTQSDI